MAIPTILLLEAAERFNQRKTLHTERQKSLQKASSLLNEAPAQSFNLLSKLDTKERVVKRIERLQKSLPSFESFDTIKAASRAFMAKRIIGRNDLLQAHFLDKGSIVSKSVGRVVLKKSAQQVAGFGTGFMISPRLFITNNHVLPNRADAHYSHVEMNYQLDDKGNLQNPVSFNFDVSSFFYTKVELDMTVVAIKGNTETEGIGWNRLIEEEGKVMVGEYMNIIQHPDGRPKELSFRSNRLMDVLPYFLHYETDTEPGSSGAPVYNDQWEIVALHHSGVPQRNSDGKILTRDGNIWTPDMGEAAVHWIANEGVRISVIANHLKSLQLAKAEKILRNEIFDKESFQPPSSVSSVHSTSKVNLTVNDISGEWEGDKYRLQLPLQITIDKIALNPKDDEKPIATGITLEKPSVSGPAMAEKQKRLEIAFKELAEARSKPYYNQKEDETHRKLYYRNIKIRGKNGNEMYKALSELVQLTHTQKVRYSPARYVYSWVDWQPNKKLRSIYSWKEFTPEELIEEDISNEMKLENFSRSLMKEKGRSEVEFEKELDLLEASLMYNCEHVVPQSWFGKKEPMRGDLHHLFTCEGACNSFRNKIPYYDFPDFEEAVRTDCGKREKNKFEPENGKGEVARATLYFLLRYPGQINANANEYTPARIQTLLNWHSAYKITLHERHRNAAIFAIQGNRNPLIDYPQWAKKINFLKGLGKRK